VGTQITLGQDVVERSAGAPTVALFAVAVRVDLKKQTRIILRLGFSAAM
jgi:hypothetical protein